MMVGIGGTKRRVKIGVQMNMNDEESEEESEEEFGMRFFLLIIA